MIHQRLGLGIDTGGTYTDGVLFDLDAGMVISAVKTLTTREDLGLCITRCLKRLNIRSPEDLVLVALSTTLATNSIVEGQGESPGVVLIGPEDVPGLPSRHVLRIKGGHDVNGNEVLPLDIDTLARWAERVRGEVRVFAISGYMSVRNPEHEQSARTVIMQKTGLPVVCGHELTSVLGYRERTITATFNAKLIPLISDLLRSVKLSLDTFGIKAPLMMVRGDGTLINERVASQRPVETILSGPAASIAGGMFLTGLGESVVVDIGGTTTDIAVLHDRRPCIDSEGATVGGWRTRVRAADISTLDTGGDSHIQVGKDGSLRLGPRRVIPISYACNLYGRLSLEIAQMERFDTLSKSKTRCTREPGTSRNVSSWDPLFFQPVDVLVPGWADSEGQWCARCSVAGAGGSAGGGASTIETLGINGVTLGSVGRIVSDLSEAERMLLSLLKDGPHTVFYLTNALGMDVDLLPVSRLIGRGLIHLSSLTPTDVLHVTGEFSPWDQEAAHAAVSIQARRIGLGVDEFTCRVKEEMTLKISREVLRRLFAFEQNGRPLFKSDGSKPGGAEALVRAALSQGNREVDIFPRVRRPIVGIGAPASAYLPAVARRLGTAAFIPREAPWANAVGAITSSVTEVIEILIHQNAGGRYAMFSPKEKREFDDLNSAKTYACALAQQMALSLVRASGAQDAVVSVKADDSWASIGEGDCLHVRSRIVATATGKPRWGVGEVGE